MMQTLFSIHALFFLLVLPLMGTDKIQTVIITTPVLHTSDEGEVKFAKIPYTGWDIQNLYYSSAYYSAPYMVLERNKHLKENINLTSAYNLKVQSNYQNGITTIYISTLNAQKPDAHRFSIEEVVNYTTQAIRSDYPDKQKHIIKITKKSIKDVFKDLQNTK